MTLNSQTITLAEFAKAIDHSIAATAIDAGVTRIGATATAAMCDDFVKWRAGELQLERAEAGPTGGY